MPSSPVLVMPSHVTYATDDDDAQCIKQMQSAYGVHDGIGSYAECEEGHLKCHQLAWLMCASLRSVWVVLVYPCGTDLGSTNDSITHIYSLRIT